MQYRYITVTEERVGEVQTAREAEMAAAQSRFAELTSAMDEKRRKAVLHLENCLKKEIERHDALAAQLAATRTDAQMRLALAGLQVQQAEEAQGRQAHAQAGVVGTLHGAHEAEVVRLARAHDEHATQAEREHVTVTLPLHYRYIADTLPLHYRYIYRCRRSESTTRRWRRSAVCASGSCASRAPRCRGCRCRPPSLRCRHVTVTLPLHYRYRCRPSSRGGSSSR